MLVTKGIMGQFIKWIPIVVSIALLFSLLESFFFLPMRLTWLGKDVKGKDSFGKVNWFSSFEKRFEKLMRIIIRRRYIVLVGFGILVVFSFFMMFGANKFILFPADQTEVYIARLEMPKGTRIEETYAQLEDLSLRVKGILKDDVIHIVARAGVSQMGPNDPKGQEGNNVGMLVMYVSEYTKLNRYYTEVLKDLKQIKPIYVESLTFEELVNGPPVGNAIDVTFRSNSNEDLKKITNIISSKFSKIDGVENLKVNDTVGDDEIFVGIDYAKAARLGINVKQ